MMFGKILVPILGASLLFGALTSVASDEKREAEMAADIQKTLNLGHPIWLDANGKKFLGLRTDTTKSPNDGVVILIHDTGGHPNQQAVIKNLRAFFPEHRWTTLSIQMPVREAGAAVQDYYSLFPEAKSRLLAAINLAKSEKAEKIAVIGYGLGGLMASYALANEKDEKIVSALITISLPTPATDDENAKTLQLMSKLKVPMLDIYGEKDMPDVVQNARDRQVAAKPNSAYRQVQVDNEGHLFLHDGEGLVKRIYSWLNSGEIRRVGSN